MSDNTQLSASVGSGDTIRDLDRAGVKTQIVALDLDPAGSETLMAGAMPCSQSGTWNVATVTTVTTVSAVTSITNTVKVQGGAASGAAAAGNPVQTGGAYNTTQPTVTDGQAVQLQATARGELMVAPGGVSGFPVTFASAQPVTQSGTWNVATVTTVTTVSTVTSITNVVHVDDNSGSLTVDNATLSVTGHGTASGALRVELPTDGTGLVSAAQSGTWTVQPGNTANTTPWLVTQTPATSGGCSISSGITSGASNQDQTSVKASAGQIFGYAAFNTTASARYLKVYNKSAPTSSDTPVLRVYLPATGGANVDIPNGIACGTAIGYRVTTGAADNDTGACSANDALVNIWYK